MADQVIQITDGTTTINLDGTGDYKTMFGWRPAITTRRRGVMGNQLPWNDVVESMPITITGTDIDDLIASETALINLIDQAQRWQDGEDVDAVIFKYRSQDSTITNPVQSTILGTSGPALSYSGSPEYGIANTTLTHRATLTFRRLGVWLGDEESETTASMTHTEVVTDIFTGNAGIPSPVEFLITGFTGSDDSGGDPVGSNVAIGITKSGFVDELNTSAATVVTVPGSGTFNVTSTIRRSLVPNSAGTYTLDYSPVLTDSDISRPHSILLKLNNKSTTISYNIYAQSYSQARDAIIDTTQQITVAAGANGNNPHIVRLPLIFHRGETTGFLLHFIPSSTGGSGEALDVGDFVIQIMDETSQITTVDGINRELSVAHDGNVHLRNGLLPDGTANNPIFYELYGGELVPNTFTLGVLLSEGTGIAVWMMGTTGTDWEIINGEDGGVHTDVSSTFVFSRRIAYLVPQ